MRTIEIGQKSFAVGQRNRANNIRKSFLGGPRLIENIILHQFLQFLKLATNENDTNRYKKLCWGTKKSSKKNPRTKKVREESFL